MSQPLYPVTNVTVFAIRWWGAIAFVYGSLICIGGPGRWSSPTYRALNEVPESPYSWGSVAILAGLLITAGSLARSLRLRNVGLWLFAGWCAVIGSGFVLAAIRDSHVSLGIAVLFVAAAGHTLALTRTDERSAR